VKESLRAPDIAECDMLAIFWCLYQAMLLDVNENEMFDISLAHLEYTLLFAIGRVIISAVPDPALD
jgi:hypothetical protein